MCVIKLKNSLLVPCLCRFIYVCFVPDVFSSVAVHSVDQLIVERHQVADQPCGTQAWTLPPGQEVLQVAVQVQILTAKLIWDLHLICRTLMSM